MAVVAASTLLLAGVVPPPSFARDAPEPTCSAPAEVCAARDSVFAISSYDPYGSAVRIGEDLLVTNRHLVADERGVTVHLPGGETIAGVVLPTVFAEDLVLVRAALPAGPSIARSEVHVGDEVFTIGAGLDKARTIEVLAPGKVRALPPPDKPLARLHHGAATGRGNSGGALVDRQGRLVGIAASGGEGRFEAIPASALVRLTKESQAIHAAASGLLGKAYRDCYAALDAARESRTPELGADLRDRLVARCRASGNRQLYDLAAQALGRARALDLSASLFEESLAIDPNAANTRLSLAITLAFARKHGQALPHIEALMTIMPEELRVHQMAVQAAKALANDGLGRRALALIETHNPRGLPAAKRFLSGEAGQPMSRPRRMDQLRPRRDPDDPSRIAK